MTTRESVVSLERYEQGVTWQQWMDTIDRNKEGFEDNYNDMKTVDADDVAAIKALMEKPNGPAKVICIGEPWCPDVVRGLPALQRLCEETGLELRIFFRDQNLDIMNEFLNRGEFQSIPTMVFYTKNMDYLGHWIERAKKADAEMPQMQAIGARARNEALSEEERAAATAEGVAFRRGPIWGGWRDAEVKEMRELLEEACK